MGKFEDLTGLTFGRLTVLRRAPNDRRGQTYWVCLCVCDNETITRSASLKSGHAQSCGCLHVETAFNLSYKHGFSGTPECAALRGAFRRCNDPDDPGYHRYGGRGIKVHEEYIFNSPNGVRNLIKDIGKRPSAEHSLDRINNHGNYEPGNVRWATGKEQQRNTRLNRLLTFNGKTQCVAAWAEELCLSLNMIRNRLKRGWTVERALTIKKRPYPF